MKAKVYIGVVLAITIAALCAHFLRQPAENSIASNNANGDVPVGEIPAATSNKSPSVSNPNESQQLAADKAVSVPAAIPNTFTNAPVAAQIKPLPVQPQDATVVRSQVIRLGHLSLENDAASLREIVSELTNANKIIRQAALGAAVDFGSKDAAPGLRAAASVVEDPYEKVALLDAASFVELPDFSEIARKNKSAGPRTNVSRLGSRGKTPTVQTQ